MLAAGGLLYAQGREKRVVPVSDALRQSYDRQTRVAVLVASGIIRRAQACLR
jgi:hypothetical protein